MGDVADNAQTSTRYWKVDISYSARDLQPRLAPTFAMEARYVDAKDYLPRPAQRLDSHPGKQGLIELVYDE